MEKDSDLIEHKSGSDSEGSFSVDAFMFRAETNTKATACPGPLKGTVGR